jgi:hypothetical protein
MTFSSDGGRATTTQDEDEDGEYAELPPPEVLDSLTPELSSQLVENITARRFKLKLIQEELTTLNRKGFPLPQSLSPEQWKNLMLFKDR